MDIEGYRFVVFLVVFFKVWSGYLNFMYYICKGFFLLYVSCDWGFFNVIWEGSMLLGVEVVDLGELKGLVWSLCSSYVNVWFILVVEFLFILVFRVD